MTATQLVFLLAVAAAEALVLGASVRAHARRRPGRALAILAGGHALLVLLVATGGHLESRHGAYEALRDRLREALAERTASGLAVAGDPALAARIEHATPELAAPDGSDADALRAWQARARAALARLLPDSASAGGEPPGLRVLASERLDGGVQRDLVAVTAPDGTTLPGYLLLPPRGGELRAGVVVVPGHVDRHEEGIAQTAGHVASYQRGVALELARAGFVALTLELRGFGALGAPIGLDHRTVAYNALLAGSSYRAVAAADVRAGLSALAGLDGVDPRRLGLAGTSLGGRIALDVAALDLRVAAVAVSAVGGPLGWEPAAGADPRALPHGCYLVPGLPRIFARGDLALLIAPRALLDVRPADDAPFPPGLPERLRRAWSTLGAPERLRLATPPGAHAFALDETLAFFREHL